MSVWNELGPKKRFLHREAGFRKFLGFVARWRWRVAGRCEENGVHTALQLARPSRASWVVVLGLPVQRSMARACSQPEALCAGAAEWYVGRPGLLSHFAPVPAPPTTPEDTAVLLATLSLGFWQPLTQMVAGSPW